MQRPLYCPCAQYGDLALSKANAIYQQASDVQDFVRLMNERQIIGRWLAYDPATRRLTITKRYGCECEREGNSCAACPSSCKCHCDQVRHMHSESPLAHCQCGAEYYRPLFEGVFGVPLTLYPVKTVLSGDERCVIAIDLSHRLAKE